MLKTYFHSYVFFSLDKIFYSMQNCYCNPYISPPRNHNFQLNPLLITTSMLWFVEGTFSKKCRGEAVANSCNFQQNVDLNKPILKQVVVCKGQRCKFIDVTTTFYPLETMTLYQPLLITTSRLWFVGGTFSKKCRGEAAAKSGNFQENVDLNKPILKQVMVCKGHRCKLTDITAICYPLETTTCLSIGSWKLPELAAVSPWHFLEKMPPTNHNLGTEVQNHCCYHYILSPRNHDFVSTPTNLYLKVVVCWGHFLKKMSRWGCCQL